jgi:hypothetical protein
LYEPLDPFIIEPKEGGISHPSQSDITGDRAEWDLDNSGKGQLYFSPIDGKLHLYGAEWGAWRIDQNARYFQGWGGWQWKGMDYPEKFPTIIYSDNNDNGFIDKVEMDLDGDTIFDITCDLIALNLEEKGKLFHVKDYTYTELMDLFNNQVEANWENAMNGISVLKDKGLNTQWYSFYLNPMSLNQKRDYSYWISLQVYFDLIRLAQLNNDKTFKHEITKAFFQNNWSELL